MTREFTQYANEDVKKLLSKLSDTSLDVKEYQNTMYALGCALCSSLNFLKNQKIFIVSTVEDADFLTKGVMDGLEKTHSDIKFACFWNGKVKPFDNNDFKSSPIIRRYEEPISDDIDVLIVVKSIISGACVVKTNILDVISRKNPEKIYILSPVMFCNAREKLQINFSKKIEDKFEYFTFAIDDEIKGEEVIPGIGGEVYTRLGFDGHNGKNLYTPLIVKERRKMMLNIMS